MADFCLLFSRRAGEDCLLFACDGRFVVQSFKDRHSLYYMSLVSTYTARTVIDGI